MSYSQLSASECHQLYQWRTTTDLSLRAIAQKLGRNQSTLSRELARNRSDGTIYLPDSAQQQMEERRRQSKSAFTSVTETAVAEIKQCLRQ